MTFETCGDKNNPPLLLISGLVGAAGFLNVTIHRDEYTYALNRQVEVIALVRSFRPIPVDEFDRIARPLIM